MDRSYLSIGDFSKFSRVTRETLRHYDRIGLLSPILRGENSYRYYSASQLAHVNLIRTLQELGMSLDKIKDLKERRTPEMIYRELGSQIERINQKIEDLLDARKLLLTLKESIQSGMRANLEEVTIQFLPEQPMFWGDKNDYSNGQTDYDALVKFYHYLKDRYPDLNLNYPVWGIFSKARVDAQDWIWPDRYYLYHPDGCDRRPAGLYAIGYARGGYGSSNDLFLKVTDYIQKNGFEICGDTYKEYPLNEISIPDDQKYLVRIMIPVYKKSETE